MNFNPYVAEKLMQQQQSSIRSAARNAWLLSEAVTSKLSLFDRLAARFTRKTVSKPNSLNTACCCATC